MGRNKPQIKKITRAKSLRKPAQQKLFVIQKYVMAKDANDAIRRSKDQGVDECFVDSDWKRGNAHSLSDAIGFHVEHDDE